MTVKRLDDIPGFAIDRVAAAAGTDPEVLRMENLDTDVPPPAHACEATRAAVGLDEANSYLPFTGSEMLREAVSRHLCRLTGHEVRAEHIVITAGGTEGMLDALLATTDPGDEVILTDPTYAGMIYRVRLAGAVPRLVPFMADRGEWRLNLDALVAAVSAQTRVVFLMNPSMPSGAVLSPDEWRVVCSLCAERGLWLIYNAAMERILYDGRSLLHPLAYPGMAERTIVVGSVSKEYRMIGWRTGWVAGPASIMSDIARVHIYNVVTATGIAQAGAAAALATPDTDLAACVAEWQRRRDIVCAELEGLPMIPAAGGWSQLLNVRELGFDSFTASRRLLERGKIAATPMRDWGRARSDDFIRLVFSNEPVERLRGLRDRVHRALLT